MVTRQSDGAGGELDWIATIARLTGELPSGEVGIGDDTAVFDTPSAAQLLFSSDVVVEDVHFDLAISSVSDVGWKAMAVNLSDVAAMGGTPRAAVVSIVGAGLVDLEQLYEGLLDAGRTYGCRVVGGDCSSGEKLAVSIAVLGMANSPGPVLRSGAVVGDTVFVTGPLGRSSAGMRLLHHDVRTVNANVDADRRPTPRLVAGKLAAQCGATAMMDLSDGLGMDLACLALSSRVGFALDDVPVAEGATRAEALGGGEDYELVFTAPGRDVVLRGFAAEYAPLPIAIGRVVEEHEGVTINGVALPATGYEHH